MSEAARGSGRASAHWRERTPSQSGVCPSGAGVKGPSADGASASLWRAPIGRVLEGVGAGESWQISATVAMNELMKARHANQAAQS